MSSLRESFQGPAGPVMREPRDDMRQWTHAPQFHPLSSIDETGWRPFLCAPRWGP